jgi:hypothetical protein
MLSRGTTLNSSFGSRPNPSMEQTVFSGRCPLPTAAHVKR